MNNNLETYKLTFLCYNDIRDQPIEKIFVFKHKVGLNRIVFDQYYYYLKRTYKHVNLDSVDRGNFKLTPPLEQMRTSINNNANN